MDLQISKPLTLKCGLTLPNRLVKAAMTEQLADRSHLPTPTFLRVYEAWAAGGWGLVLTGNVQVDEVHLGGPRDTAVSSAVETSTVLASFKEWAAVCNTHGTPTVVQINHPGRQSPPGAGDRGFFAKTLAPSAVPLRLGDDLISRALSAVAFGTPKAMSVADIKEVVRRFAETARISAEAGFQGVQVHGAHGYLVAQFLSAKTNTRTDEYGGSPAKRARFAVEIIDAIRAVVPKEFCVGIKLNSVDHQSEAELGDCVEQLKLITQAGVDFIEVSGGTYEDPTMNLGPSAVEGKSERTKAREAFFLDFAAAIRDQFPDVPLVVTGGFRTRQGMESAVREGGCDAVGIGRPAVLNPSLPVNTVFNKEVDDASAKVYAKKVETPWFLQKIGMKNVGAGIETAWYAKAMRDMDATKASI
ncbi:NADPH dehydrogenase [Verticillium alfalfae VaMs.102]|uniref:NADPH dehydrogenase n=1 Tax=Verticillium alfalfae (strain VaMs.102 / ATCC MYA-4576 / FGSC 10136) TaxID=526221 RepID=C9SWS7_VERA1|nr:NADPH dehydrogenase [Verticillium alfalfae VaMs.102]EEY23468.1 NADPH dehydrogenase [Verticillium alfalfae VaMs.102]